MNDLLLATSALRTVLSVIVALLILLATITVHEFGHYIVGKIFKFKIKEFAIGMGPAIFKKTKKNGEIFSIRIFPLGGFCAFEGEDEDDETVRKENEKLAKKGLLKTEENPSDKNLGDTEQNTAQNTADTTPTENTDGSKKTADVYGEYANGDNSAQNGTNGANGANTADTADATPIDTENTTEKQTPKTLSKDAFNNKKPWQRILVLLAGATFNFVVAVLIVIIYFTAYGHFGFMAYEIRTPKNQTESVYTLSGEDVLLEINGKFLYFTTDINDTLGGKKKGDLVSVTVLHKNGEKETLTVALRDDVNPVSDYDVTPALKALGVASVLKLSTEEGCPLKDGNYVYRFYDKEERSDCTRIYDLDDLYSGLKALGDGETIRLIVQDADNDGENDVVTLTAPINYGTIDKSDRGAVLSAFGIKNEERLSYQVSTESVKFGFFEGVGRAVVYSFKTVGVTLKSFWQLLTGKLGLSMVSGPIGTITVTSQYVSLGFKYVLNIASMIGLSVAIFNLLPIPALDGARAVFVLIEWIRKKPINRNVEGMIHFIGLIVLILFAVTVDLLKLF